MTRLERLLQRLCPEGVEHVPLWSVTIWDKKFSGVDRKKQPKIINYNYLLASDLFSLQTDSGNVFLLSTGEKTGWTTEKLAGQNLHEGEVVTIPWGKSRAVTDCIKYYKGKFVTADNRIMTSNDTTKLSNRYLYYWIMSVGKVIDSFYRGSGIKHPDMAKVLDLRIPVPPLEVQQEIVWILDQFTQLTTELTTREKQYHYYRSKLLAQQTNAQKVSLRSVVKHSCSGATPAKNNSDYYAGGAIPWLRTQDVRFNEIYSVDSFITEKAVEETAAKWIPENCVIVAISGATAGRCAINKIKTTTNQHCLNLEIDAEKALYKYVYYCVCNQHEELLSKKQGARGDLNSSLILGMKISLPPLPEQRRIVSILDRFDTLCNDLTSGLPAEIAARQKQYEYYRDKLLTFKEKMPHESI